MKIILPKNSITRLSGLTGRGSIKIPGSDGWDILEKTAAANNANVFDFARKCCASVYHDHMMVDGSIIST